MWFLLMRVVLVQICTKQHESDSLRCERVSSCFLHERVCHFYSGTISLRNFCYWCKFQSQFRAKQNFNFDNVLRGNCPLFYFSFLWKQNKMPQRRQDTLLASCLETQQESFSSTPQCLADWKQPLMMSTLTLVMIQSECRTCSCF